MMCPRLPWLTVRGAPWSPGHHPVYQGCDPSIRVGCLKAGSVPHLPPAQPAWCPAPLGPSLLTGDQHFSQLLLSPSLTGRKCPLKILPEGIQKKVRISCLLGCPWKQRGLTSSLGRIWCWPGQAQGTAVYQDGCTEQRCFTPLCIISYSYLWAPS